MTVDKVEIQNQPITSKSLIQTSEFKHDKCFDFPYQGDEETPQIMRDYQNSKYQGGRFKDPFIEFVFSSKTKQREAVDAINELKKVGPNNKNNPNCYTSSDINNSNNEQETSNNSNDTKVSEKQYYSKVYINPILNKRDKITDKPKNTVTFANSDVANNSNTNNAAINPVSTYRSTFSSNSNKTPIYKAPTISKLDTYQLSQRKFYTSTYNKMYQSNPAIHDGNNQNNSLVSSSHPQQISDNNSSKWKPLTGSLNNHMVKGRYHVKDKNPASGSNFTTKKIDSIIYPFKN